MSPGNVYRYFDSKEALVLGWAERERERGAVLVESLERTGDRRWRDRIVNGMTTIGGLKRRWFAGEAPFDLATGRYQGQGDYVAVSHLNAVFGVAEMNAELLDLLDVPSYRRAWLEYCRYYNASDNEIAGLLGEAPKGRSLTEAHSRLTAFAANKEGDAALAQRAWSEFLGRDPAKLQALLGARSTLVGGVDVLRPIQEDAQVSTNDAAQWSLAAIENLALIGDSLEEAAARLGYRP